MLWRWSGPLALGVWPRHSSRPIGSINLAIKRAVLVPLLDRLTPDSGISCLAQV